MSLLFDIPPPNFNIRKYKRKPRMFDIGDSFFIIGNSYTRKHIKAKKRHRCKISHHYWLTNLVKTLDHIKDINLIKSLISQINHRDAIPKTPH